MNPLSPWEVADIMRKEIPELLHQQIAKLKESNRLLSNENDKLRDEIEELNLEIKCMGERND